jgi:uncharacterized protein YdeI (YjbR/CyaY-like superfamily)
MPKESFTRIVTVPKDVKAALTKQKIKPIFDKLAYSHQKEHITWIDSAKKPETRQARIEKMMKMLTQR